MSVNKIWPSIPKNIHFKDFERLLKMSFTCPTVLLDRPFFSLKNNRPRSILRFMESYFDSNSRILSKYDTVFEYFNVSLYIVSGFI